MNVSLRHALKPVLALLIGTSLLYVGFGLQTTLVPLRAEAEGFGRFALGLLGASYYLGFVAGCVLAPYVILRAGHIRAFAAMVSTGSAAAVAFPLLIEPLFWDLCRIVIGFCVSGILIIVESWLNERATNVTRGIVMSAYIVLTYAMMTVGQLLVITYPLGDFALFTIASILFSLAAVPVALTRSTQPAPIAVVHFRPWRLISIAPAAFGAALAIGLIQGAFWALGPAFATGRGFSTSDAAVFMSVAVVGGALGQWPFGRFSDFVDRRKVLVAAMLGAAVAGILLWQLASLSVAAILIMGFLFGAFTLPAYSLAVAHAFDWAEPDDMVETSASIIALYGVGSIVGPLIAPVFMQELGGDALFLYTALVSLGLVGFVAVRILRRPAPSPDDKSDFDIYSTAPVGGAITPDAIAAEMPMVEVPQDGPVGADVQDTADVPTAGTPDGAGRAAGEASAAAAPDAVIAPERER